MLAAMFGLGRMIRSLANEKQAPSWLIDKKDVPYRGIIFSGIAMLLALAGGLLLPRVYLFLISSGGFALLFTYAVIMATHLKFRKENGCPPKGNCQMPLYPYTSWIALIALILVIVSMPFISGQGAGLIAGLLMLVLFSCAYLIQKQVNLRKKENSEGASMKENLQNESLSARGYTVKRGKKAQYSVEFSDELTDRTKKKNRKSEEDDWPKSD
jgi:L-asparagine transporter-like permease